MDVAQSSTEPLRVCIRIPLKYIPGEHFRRPDRLGQLFCKSHLRRPLCTKEGHDYIHIPPNFDGEGDVKCWFILDFNVSGPIDSRELLEQVRHECYQGCLLDDGQLYVNQATAP
jgi:hypothetical protein